MTIRTVQAPMSIEDGKHEGVITALEFREKPFAYIDLVIEFEEGKKIKAGFPDFLSPTSQLGKMMQNLGIVVDIDMSIDIENVLIGQKITFMTMKEGQYSNVVKGSIKKAE